MLPALIWVPHLHPLLEPAHFFPNRSVHNVRSNVSGIAFSVNFTHVTISKAICLIKFDSSRLQVSVTDKLFGTPQDVEDQHPATVGKLEPAWFRRLRSTIELEVMFTIDCCTY